MVERSAEISPVLASHSELAETTRLVFSILTILYVGILFLPSLLKKEIKPLLQRVMVMVFLLIYLVGALILVNTASLSHRRPIMKPG